MGAIVQEYFSIRELTRYCGVSERTLRTWLKQKALPFFCVERKILISRKDFDLWMNQFRADKDRVTKLADELLENIKA